jgi:hypothetical protein
LAQPVFRAVELLERLVRAGVRFVLIGGYAAQLHGSPVLTRDIDVCYARDGDDLERLAALLRELDARLRGAPPGLPFRMDATTLRNGDAFTLTTRLGDLDIIGVPAGTEGYEQLTRTADEYDLGPVSILVASIEDLMRMKRAAGRPKDLFALEHLAALRDELGRRGDG